MGNVHSPYISIRLADITLTWRGDENRPDYFTSLTHTRQPNKANQMTINITYCPHKGEDPNKVESAIVRSKGQCLVQYGDLGQIVAQYRANIIAYTTQINSGVLMYTLTLVSQAVAYNFDSVPAMTWKRKEDLIGPVQPPKPGVLTLTDPDWNEFVTKFYDSVDKVLRIPQNNNNTGHYYYIDREHSFNITNGIGVTVPSTVSVPTLPPFESLANFVSQIPLSDFLHDQYLVISIDDTGTGPGRVRIVKIDPNEIQLAETFEWGSKDGTVLSFAPSYNGTYLIFKNGYHSTDQMSNYVQSSMLENSEGTYSSFTVINNPTISSNFFDAGDVWSTINTATTNDEALNIESYSYSATLKVLGRATTLLPGRSVIEVTPLINGQAHFSAGKYIVLGITDEVNSSGFTTTYTLRRRVDEESSGRYDSTYNGRDGKQTYVYTGGALVPLNDFKPNQNQGANQ